MTNDSKDQGHEAFEAWARTDDGNCNDRDLERREDGDYHNMLVQRDWEVWQAALATSASALARDDIQRRAIECGFKYWRAPDAHGVTGTTAQAVDFLQDLLGVEVEIQREESALARDEASVLTDERIGEIAASIGMAGIVHGHYSMFPSTFEDLCELARAIEREVLAAASAQATVSVATLYEILMLQNIVTGEESYLSLKCVGVPPTEAEFVSAVQRTIAAAPSPAASEAGDGVKFDLNAQMTPFGMLVRALRIVAGTTLYDMAKHLQCSSAMLSGVECGRKPLTDAMVAETAAYFSSLGIHDTLHALVAARLREAGSR